MKKISALFVLMAYLFTMQLSAQPLTASGGDGSVIVAEQEPTVVERKGPSYSAPRKKSPLPIILGVLAAGALVALLVLVVVKTKYDITGAWDVHLVYNGGGVHDLVVTFIGDRKSGTLTVTPWTPTGIYSVDGENVSFNFNWTQPAAFWWKAMGEFDSKDSMSGTFLDQDGASGAWEATRR